jgi:ribonuclease Z
VVGLLKINSCAADHDIPCLAYRMSLDRAPAFLPERARALGLPEKRSEGQRYSLWKLLQSGEAVEFEGRTIRPEEVMGPLRPGLAFGFLTDSRPTQKLVEFFSDVDLLICEATYGDPADRPKAIENKHMTFAEAATFGAAARARLLWFTHFTPAMPNPDYFRREAEAIYPNVVLGREHLTTTLAYVD